MMEIDDAKTSECLITTETDHTTKRTMLLREELAAILQLVSYFGQETDANTWENHTYLYSGYAPTSIVKQRA